MKHRSDEKFKTNDLGHVKTVKRRIKFQHASRGSYQIRGLRIIDVYLFFK